MVWHSYWVFLLFVPLLILFYWLWSKRNILRSYLKFSSVATIKTIPMTLKARLSLCPVVLLSVAMVFALIALARPQEQTSRVRRNVEGIDIIVALDVSDSMLIEDMRPENRLTSSKETIKRFIEKRTSDRIGLIVFSGESYTRVPLTLDYQLLQKSLLAVETSKNIKMGTAIGVALANAVGRLRESKAKSRIVIFLTDGENNSGTIDPETALDIAKGYGIRIYSIGMGKDGQAQLPVFYKGANGVRLKRYRPIHSKINEVLLGRMASETGGKYFRTVTSKALRGVFEEIDKLERTNIEVSQFTQTTELFSPYLFIAIGLYLTGIFLKGSFLRRGP